MVVFPITKRFLKFCVKAVLHELCYCFLEQLLDILHACNVRCAQKLSYQFSPCFFLWCSFFCPFLFLPCVCFCYTLFMEFTQDLGWFRRRFARLIRVISAALFGRRHSAYCRTYPAVVPITHVVPPYHCFQLLGRVICASPASTVKQLFFNSCPHTFAAGIIMTPFSCTIHALPDIKLVQRTSVKFTGVLTSSVGMEYSAIKIRIRLPYVSLHSSSLSIQRFLGYS